MSTAKALQMDIIPKFLARFTEQTLAKYVTFQSWSNFSESATISEEFCFFDEVDDTRVVATFDNNTLPEARNFSAISCTNADTCRLIWVVIASTHKHDYFEEHFELNGFVFCDLSWQLRNSHNTSYVSNIILADQKSMNLTYPIYGARSRIHSYDTKPNFQERMNYCVNEVGYWLGQVKTGSVLIYYEANLFVALKEDLCREFNIELEDLNKKISVHVANAPSNIRLYYGNQQDQLTGLEFDIVINVRGGYHSWKLLSRAKYGVSWLYWEFDGNKKAVIEYLKRWGRCAMIEH